MKNPIQPRLAVTLLSAAALFATTLPEVSDAQPAGRGGFGRGGPGGPPQASNLPSAPTAVTLPTISARITGPGPMFDSDPSHAAGMTPDDFGYGEYEYFVSGTANGEPYTTRVVVRRPIGDRRFSGLVLAEAMHSSGSAHGFEFNAAYLMDAGHAAVEINTTAPNLFTAFNAERYADLKVANGQTNEILAQVGALMKSRRGPFEGSVRNMILFGTSMSAGVLINYLPAHAVYRTPDMQHIYNGFMPTSNGSTIPETDVPLVHLPTMHEIGGDITRRQDGDVPGRQYRLYEFAGLGHVDSRDNVRLLPNPCVNDLNTIPLQAYYSVGLHHLFRWVDEGIVPPRAPRTLLDRDTSNDGSMMALDAHGNPIGGIPTPYVDVPVAGYTPVNVAREPLIDNPSDYVAANGIQGAQIMCRLSAWQESFSKEKLRGLYGSKENYVRMFSARLDELEAAGWSLPVHHWLILGDAAKVDF